MADEVESNARVPITTRYYPAGVREFSALGDRAKDRGADPTLNRSDVVRALVAEAMRNENVKQRTVSRLVDEYQAKQAKQARRRR